MLAAGCCSQGQRRAHGTFSRILRLHPTPFRNAFRHLTPVFCSPLHPPLPARHGGPHVAHGRALPQQCRRLLGLPAAHEENRESSLQRADRRSVTANPHAIPPPSPLCARDCSPCVVAHSRGLVDTKSRPVPSSCIACCRSQCKPRTH